MTKTPLGITEDTHNQQRAEFWKNVYMSFIRSGRGMGDTRHVNWAAEAADAALKQYDVRFTNRR